MTIEHRTKHMFTLSEVADQLHVHRNTLRRWANQGAIKTYRISQRGDRRFAQEDIDKFLETLNTKLGSSEDKYGR